MDYSDNCINGTLTSVGGLVGNVHLPTISEDRVRTTQDGDVRQTENGNVRLIKIYVNHTLHATLENVSGMNASLTIPPVRGGIA